MYNQNLISIIGAILILAVIVLFTFVIIRKRNNNGKEEAFEFLNSLGEELLGIVLDTIKEISPKEFTSAYEFEAFVLKSIYDKCWDFIQEYIDVKIGESDPLFAKVIKLISKEDIILFIDDIVDKYGIAENIEGEYATYQIEHNNISEIDKELEEKFSDQEEYIEKSNDEDLAPAEEQVHTEEELASLNPQRDEEESFDIQDDSMELVTEEEHEIIKTEDKNGNTLYYEISADGKKKRVTKDYALKYIK